MNRCPTCGATYPDDARFCTRDGARLLGATPRNLPAVSPPAPPKLHTMHRETALHGRHDASAPVTHANLVGKTLQGHYEIVRKVGEGGMSVVYLARDIATGE